MRLPALTSLVFLAAMAVAQRQGSPFSAPNAVMQYAPDRTCDLLNLDVELDVNYAKRSFTGKTINTFKSLRKGTTEVVMMAGAELTIASVLVDGVNARFSREGGLLKIAVAPLAKGQELAITVSYTSVNAKGTGFGSGGGGFHWIEPVAGNETRVGFWTQGETNFNSKWAPTWDYPNDLATSRTRCTVDNGWDVIGNGTLVGTTLSKDKKRKTFEWKMTQPHATYLLCLYGGPLDIKKDKWQGIDLWYVVPRGDAYLIDDSFGNTKDMLTFFSNKLGVKYPWPKYAQCAMYNFGGGMENVSATILGSGNLTEARDGYFNMDSLNAHELAHQWFGDLVTCKDWGDTWLNESFATFMEMAYLENSRGKAQYENEVNSSMLSYFSEARRYKRPLSTKFYSNGDAMFDSHSYPKGGVILHTLRRFLGDDNFYAGLNAYLTKWRHTPVESAQLRRSMTEATGINCERFWAQWIEAPGHPVLDMTYTTREGKLEVQVKQTQDTTTGVPVYDIPANIGVIYEDGKKELRKLHISKVDETFEYSVTGKVAAVILDPEQDFLREITPKTFTAAENLAIVENGWVSPDRRSAMLRIVRDPSDQAVELLVKLLKADPGVSPVFTNTVTFANLGRPELRDFWISELEHKSFERRSAAVLALAKLPQEAATTAKLRSLVNPKAPIQVVLNSIRALADWDANAHKDIFEAALSIKDKNNRIKNAAQRALNSLEGRSGT